MSALVECNFERIAIELAIFKCKGRATFARRTYFCQHGKLLFRMAREPLLAEVAHRIGQRSTGLLVRYNFKLLRLFQRYVCCLDDSALLKFY